LGRARHSVRAILARLPLEALNRELLFWRSELRPTQFQSFDPQSQSHPVLSMC